MSVPKDQRFSNLKVDNSLVVGDSLVARRIQSAELVVTSTNSARAKDLTVDDLVVLNTFLLPTTGGTASPLTFYQELSSTVDFTSAAFNGTQTVAVKLTRVGNLVSMTLSGFEVLGNGVGGVISAAAGSIPSQFRPAESVTLSLGAMFTAFAGGLSGGFLGVGSDGSLTVTLGIVASVSGTQVLLATPFPATVASIGYQTIGVNWNV